LKGGGRYGMYARIAEAESHYFRCLISPTHESLFLFHRRGGLDVIRIQMGGTRMLLRD
jgi:hypothetical protein